MQRAAGAQAEVAGEIFQRGDGGAAGIGVRPLDDHHPVGIHRGKHDAERARLFAPADAVAGRWFAILMKPAVVVEEGVEPFDVVAGKAQRAGGGGVGHAASFAEICFHASLMVWSRRSASFIASGGTPRACITSGWVSRTSTFHALRA